MSTQSVQILIPGSRFGVYQVGPCIGQGAMGQVYRAEHTLLKKPVALKIMSSSVQNSPTGRHRFTREARAAAAIKHPNVVDIVDMGVLNGLPFIVMEFLEGEDLQAYLQRNGNLSERQLADLALPIIAAIGAAHDAGVTHRDIKPSNIFLATGPEEDRVPKLLDFGISKSALRPGESEFVTTGPEDLIGTPLYIAPEALRGPKNLSPRSDQYSLGVVLYVCMTGRHPHEGKDLASLVRSVLSDPIEPLRRLRPDASRELEVAVMRALSRNPQDRFEHVRELGGALWGLASRRAQHVWAKRFSDLSSSLDTASPLSWRRWRPVSWRWRSAAVLALIAVCVLSFAWQRARRSGPVAPAALAQAQLALASAPPAPARREQVPASAPAPVEPARAPEAPAPPEVAIVRVTDAQPVPEASPRAAPASRSTPRPPRPAARRSDARDTREPSEPAAPPETAPSALQGAPRPAEARGANDSPLLD